MTRRARTTGTGLHAVVLMLLVAAPAQAAGHPVPYTFAADIAGAAFPYTSPPGANDWNCRPTAAHPEPVVLVHGFASVQNDTWQTFAPLLANNGYCVFALNYGVPAGTPFPADQVGGVQAIEASAAQLAAFVATVLAATGASRVDIVGHSGAARCPTTTSGSSAVPPRSTGTWRWPPSGTGRTRPASAPPSRSRPCSAPAPSPPRCSPRPAPPADS